MSADALITNQEFHSEEYAFEYLYPYPLADLYRRYRVSRTAADKLGYLLACSEAALKFVGALAFSLIPEKTAAKTKLFEGNYAQLSSPSFGTWVHLLKELSPLLDSGVGTPLSRTVVSCIGSHNGRPSQFIRAMQDLVARRNEYVHAQAITSAPAEALLDTVLPVFRAGFRELLFLTKCVFVVCEEITWLRRPECFEATVRICRGSNPIFPFELWRLEKPVDPHVPLLISPDLSTAHTLHPLLATFAEGTGMPGCYFYFKKGRSAQWQTYQSLAEKVRPGTGEMSADIEEWLAGKLEPRALPLQFQAGVKPAWVLSLISESQPSAPIGYSLLGLIGEGRFGTVHKALHTGLDEVRAVKFLRPEAAHDPRIRKRFEIEAQAISKLRGKGVTLEIFDYGESEGGVPFLIMQLAEQGSLEEALTRWGARTDADVLDIAISCFTSLDVVHKLGVLHRDLKLSNILLFGDGYVFCDFGAGKLLDSDLSLTLEGDIIGTMSFMAPEQRHGTADARSDMFSLGVCMVHLLAGAQVNEPRGWLYNNAALNLELRNTILSIIEPIPENRPPSAAAVVGRLRSLRDKLRSEQVQAEPEAVTEGALQAVARSSSTTQGIWKAPDGTVFREIPAGEFLMGGTKFPDERPVHKVEISSPFFLATTLVTNAQFEEFRRATHYRNQHAKFLLHLRRDHFEAAWREPSAPVVFISWSDAKEYVLWRCERDNRDYRLPTEAEWEYACRAGSRTVYPWGNLFDNRRLNVGQAHGHPTPVGMYAANTWGLFDMLGNVWEWTEDIMDVSTHEESLFYRHCADLPGGVAIDPVNSGLHALASKRVPVGLLATRGGSFFSEGHNCRPANRRGQQNEPTRAVGFRLLLHNPPASEVVVSKLE
jgi:formylglycine-generating enzyme required for sulfatase activity/tRNA A-37 threonylcarbamoyl transferase component Bud32